MKATTCVTLGATDTLYNNGEQTPAGPRDSNRFQNVRVAALSACGQTGPFTKAQRSASPVVPYVCKDPSDSDTSAFADSVTLTTRVDDKRIAAGTVAWTYTTPAKGAREMVCLVQRRGEVGVTLQRECFVTAPGAASAKYSVELRPDTVLLTAEVRRLGTKTCIGYDVSNSVQVPQKYVPFGTNLVNKLKVCLVSKASKLVYGSCKSAKAVKTVASVDELGAISGVFTTPQGQCVVLEGSTVALGACAEGGGWMAWKQNSYKDYAHQCIREFGSNMCMPFGTENAKFGKAPKLIDCTVLANM